MSADIGAADLKLARDALAGDKTAWDALFLQILQPYINGLAAKAFLPGHHDLFEEAVLESVYQVYANLGKFRGEARITTWCYFYVMQSIAKCWQMLKERRSGSGLDELTPSEAGQLAKWHPEEEMERRLLMMKVEEALHGMSPIYRRAIELHVLDGLSAVEIAQREGVSLNTAKSWLKRARRKLKDHFDAE